MTDREAIKDLTSYAEHSWGGLNESFNIAILAIQEREERSKGCTLCYTDAKYNPFVGGYNYCPMCGRKLKGENE